MFKINGGKILLSLVTSLLFSACLLQGDSLFIPSELKKEATVVAFDCHGVLFTFNYLKLATILAAGVLAVWGGTKLLGAKIMLPLVGAFLGGWTVFGGWLLLQKKLYGGAPSVESYLQGDSLVKKGLLKFWLFFANLFVPEPEVFKTAWDLKREGYKIVLASNIGKGAFAELKERHGNLFNKNGTELFDGYFYPGCSWLLNNKEVKEQNKSWVIKADSSYFDILFSFIKEKILPETEQVVLIDDSSRFIGRAKNDKRFDQSILFE